MITKENAKEWIALLQAMAEGKAVQLHTRETWADTDFLWSGANPEDYRIKPEPRRFWMRELHDGTVAVYVNREAAEMGRHRVIEVVEVLKD